jgi:beta-glucuronidase
MGDPGARTFGAGAIGQQAQAAHLAAIGELIHRDRNHPSVIAWSIANEPDTAEPAARDYFAPLVSAARELDPTRPVCFANVATAPPDLDVVTDLFDLVCVNRYYGWYVNTGDLAVPGVPYARTAHRVDLPGRRHPSSRCIVPLCAHNAPR